MRLALIALAACAGAVLLYPPLFRQALWALAGIEAKRQGVAIAVGSLDGGLIEGVTVRKLKMGFAPPAGVRTTIEAAEAKVQFSLWRLVTTRGQSAVSRWIVRDASVTGRLLERPEDTPPGAGPPARDLWVGWLSPGAIEIENAEITIRAGARSLGVRGLDLRLDESGEGDFAAREIALYSDFFRKRLRGVSGPCRRGGGVLSAFGVDLDDGVELKSGWLDVSRVLRGVLRGGADFGAFAGEARAYVESQPRKGYLDLAVHAWISRIAIAEMARFFELPGAAGGMIKEGKLTFLGSPNEWERATFQVRVEADDFLWGDRQWESLVLGATLANRRAQIPELVLRQADNALSLRGELTLGSTGPWWKGDFAFDVDGTCDDLNAVSNLLGPWAGEAYGKLEVDGSLRGNGGRLNGQLVISGRGLSWRGAPLNRLEAALRFTGDEIEVANLEFSNGDDFVRAKGAFGLHGDTRYQGEVKAQVKEMARYDSILGPPIFPMAPAGELSLDWTGDGWARGHSGVFRAAFRGLRALVPGAGPRPGPLDVRAEGSYAPGNVYLARLSVAQGGNEALARVTVTPDAVLAEDVRLDQGTKTTLEGRAKLPADVWGSWPYPKLDLEGPAEVELSAQGLMVPELMVSFGSVFGGEATATVALSGTGRLADVRVSGSARARGLECAGPGGSSWACDGEAAIEGSWGALIASGTFRATMEEMPTLPPLGEWGRAAWHTPALPVRSGAVPPGWKLDLAGEIAGAGPGGEGVTGWVRIGGSPAAPSLDGDMMWWGLAVPTASGPMRLEWASVAFDGCGTPSVVARVSGDRDGSRIEVEASGNLGAIELVPRADPPMEEKALARQLFGAEPTPDERPPE